MIHANRHMLDWAAWALAAVAGISLANLALTATAFAGFGSFILVCIRVHDRWKYGPSKKGWDE